METVKLNSNMTTKIFEPAIEIGIGLLATFSIHFLQINTAAALNFSPNSIANSMACMAGSFAYTRLFMKDENISNWQAFLSAIVGYTFGIYAAGFYCEYYNINFGSYHARFGHALIGFLSMLVMILIYEFGKGIRKKSQKIGETVGDAIKERIPKSKKND